MMNHSVTLSKTVLLSKNIPIADLGALIAAPGEKLSGDSQKPMSIKETHSMFTPLFLVLLKLI